MGSLSQDSVWVGKFWSFLNLSVCASGGQLGLDIVDRGKAKWDRGARQQFKRVHFGVLSTPPKNANCRLEKDFNLYAKV